MAIIVPRPRIQSGRGLVEQLRGIIDPGFTLAPSRGPRRNRADDYLEDEETPFVHPVPAPMGRRPPGLPFMQPHASRAAPPTLMPEDSGLPVGEMAMAPLPAQAFGGFRPPGEGLTQLLASRFAGQRRRPRLAPLPELEPEPLEVLRDRLVRWLASGG